MSTPCCLVLFETDGNQRFIYGTNKLTENVGASELTFRAGTTYVLNAVKDAGGPNLLKREGGVFDSDELRDSLEKQSEKPPLKESPVEVIIATSGKALLLVSGEQKARDIVASTTEAALKSAPGLDLRAALVKLDLDEPQSMHRAVSTVHKRHAALANFVPGPGERFGRLPVVEGCATSGLPASMMDKDGPNRLIPISVVTHAKRESAEQGRNRICHALERGFRLPRMGDLEEMNLEWGAVIHADGNGFGQVFLKFQDYFPEGAAGYDNRVYINRLRKFSARLDRCTRDAFRSALEALARRYPWEKAKKRDYLPIVPIVLGGDDLTVYGDGQHAVQLARDYLLQFEHEAEKLWKEVGLVRAQEGIQRFSACAGVAIIKPHYPFYAAYSLADDLLKSAKDVKKHESGASALDFHVLYDASGYDLQVIRGRQTWASERLYARPYVVSREDVARSPWSSKRRIDDLKRRIGMMRSRDEEGRRELPRGMLHELREGLFLGKDAANARLDLAKGRYGPALEKLLYGLKDGLYFEKEKDEASVTPFLDALELVDFWADENEEDPS